MLASLPELLDLARWLVDRELYYPVGCADPVLISETNFPETHMPIMTTEYNSNDGSWEALKVAL